jgi:hypothetical protein
VTTYYHRRLSDGEIVNASDVDLPLAEVERRWPISGGGLYYDAHPPMAVLQRYRYWDERP